MGATKIKASEVLLNRVLPVLQSTEITGDVDHHHRRRFFQALAASAVAAAVPFPTGWPSDYPRAISFFTHDSLTDVWTAKVGIVYSRQEESRLISMADRRMPVTGQKCRAQPNARQP